MSDAPHHNAAFINAIAEEGTKDEAVRYLQETWNSLCERRAELCETRARIRTLEAELAALREARGVRPLDCELAFQAYIDEPTPNGNTRLDNILGCIAPCPEKVERHVATQIDMAFQAGWRDALAALRALADAGKAG